jgi:hypothetical protein
MVRGMFSLVVRLRAFSAADVLAWLRDARGRVDLTLVAHVVAEPRRRECPRVQHFLKAVDDQRFPA